MKSILLSAGHSTTDPGATTQQVVACKADGTTIVTLRTEAAIVTEFRNMVSFYLTRDGIRHTIDGDNATDNWPLQQAARAAANHDLSIEFHCNAFTTPTATGVETLSGTAHYALGAALCQAISKTLGIRDRGPKAENSGQHSRLAFVQAGGIIVELFFLSNPSDLAAYDASKWITARAVAQVIAEAAALPVVRRA